MILQLPYSAKITIPDTSHAEVKTFRGDKVVVINNKHYMPFTQWGYDYFCKESGYCDYTDMIPEGITEKPIHTMESLLAFAYGFKSIWQDIESELKFYYTEITKLNNLKGEL